MEKTITIYTPVGKPPRTVRELAPRPGSLGSLRVGLLDNTKTNADAILDRVQARLAALGVAEVVRLRKPTASKGAPDPVWAELTRCQVVINALGD